MHLPWNFFFSPVSGFDVVHSFHNRKGSSFSDAYLLEMLRTMMRSFFFPFSRGTASSVALLFAHNDK